MSPGSACMNAIPTRPRSLSFLSVARMPRIALLACVVGHCVAQYAPDVSGTPIEFICAYRKLALEYAGSIGHDSAEDQGLIHDALQLTTLCNLTRPSHAKDRRSSTDHQTAPVVNELAMVPENTIYVKVDGDDTAAGTQAAPKRTVGAALEATRALKAPKALLIGAGTYHLSEPLQFTTADNSLRVAAAPDAPPGTVWLSGARPLPTAALLWQKHNVSQGRPGKLNAEAGMNNQHGCKEGTDNGRGCACHESGAPSAVSADACMAACHALGPENCTSFSWNSNNTATHAAHQHDSLGWVSNCCLRSDGIYAPTPADAHVSGHWVGASSPRNVWKTKLPADFEWPTSAPEQLRLPDNNALGSLRRAPRARHPNADPERDLWPTGYIAGAAAWLQPTNRPLPPAPVNVANAALATRGSADFQNYSGGIGGPCAVFDPPFSYWCSPHPRGGGGFQYFVPAGVEHAAGDFPDTGGWARRGAGATAHVWRRSHWANWMFDVADADEASSSITFGRGGFQGCRGGNGSDWYVEGVLELLDAPREFHYDRSEHTLYLQPNGTIGTPPSAVDLAGAVVPALQTLVSVNASQQAPVRGLRLEGIGFRDAAPTFMEPHGVPSGGDWALERRGALFFEGTEGLVVDRCKFDRNDGNAIMLSGYHRNASVTNSHFAWTGGSAVAAWGRTDELSDGGKRGWDATGGDFPRHTLVEGNLVRETGVWEKQSSCFFQAKTAQTTLQRNVCFNLARAGFNFNDGMGGGDEVHQNLIFNSCRESADHGPINSWDRQPFVTTVRDGVTPSAQMLPRNISHNFLVANYGGTNGAIDNDDGSLHYENNHNFQVYGHQKFKTGGIRSYGNVIAYASSFGGGWSAPGSLGAEAPNAMFDNVVYFAHGKVGQYHNGDPWHARNNTLFGVNVTLATSPPMTLPQWQEQNPSMHDVGSRWFNYTPDVATIIQSARRVLMVI